MEGNLPVPVTVGEGVEQGVEILRSGTVLCLRLFLALLVVEGVGNEVCEDVDNGVCEDVDNGVCIVRIDVEGGVPLAWVVLLSRTVQCSKMVVVPITIQWPMMW